MLLHERTLRNQQLLGSSPWLAGWMGWRVDGWMDKWMGGRVSRWLAGWLVDRLAGWGYGWAGGRALPPLLPLRVLAVTEARFAPIRWIAGSGAIRFKNLKF